MKDQIFVKGAKVNNLKNISVSLPKNQIICITGVSGSGKSSFAIDTLHAEGQRRYVESLSSYARQFLGKIEKPDVDDIIGICPAIALEQNNNSSNPRSTVGTITEIYEYLKLLFSRIGEFHSNEKIVKIFNFSSIVDFCEKNYSNEYIEILIKKKFDKQKLISNGYSKIIFENKTLDITTIRSDKLKNHEVFVVVDGFLLTKKNHHRILESLELSQNSFQIHIKHENKINSFFTDIKKIDGYIEPNINLFSFNNPYGACKACKGFGEIIGIDENKVIPNKKLSVYEGAVKCWSGNKLIKWKNRFINDTSSDIFPIHRAYEKLNEQQKEILWNGLNGIKGINDFFNKLDKKKYRIQNRVLISRYTGKYTCDECKGTRLRKESNFFKIGGKTISELSNLSIFQLHNFFNRLKISKTDQKISEKILFEIISRTKYLIKVGLDYLSLSRKSNTLSGGEFQRLKLTNALSSSLVGTMYVLDEPSIGLHPKDTHNLISIIKKIKNLGNTIILVEHDKDLILNSDYIIDIGPKAGKNGGEIVFEGKKNNFINCKNSLTLDYLRGIKIISKNKTKNNISGFINIENVNINNINNQNFKIPLGILCAITGVSGSGKSSLMKKILEPSLKEYFSDSFIPSFKCKNLTIDNNKFKNVEYVSQKPIGKSSRSNPATYLKIYDDIRELYAKQPLSKQRKYKSGFFSFNIEGGRCENCKGEGEINIEMQFMADVKLKCDECSGKKFKEEVLEIKFNDKNIFDILNLTVSEAIVFFEKFDEKKIVKKLNYLQTVGLEYIKLGQSSSSLSGGEAQRVKLAYFLSKSLKIEKTIFMFDEPTTGLHFEDIKKLLKSFDRLIKLGNTVICIEHNLDIIKCSDWIIDLGPLGGEKGGEITFSGTVDQILNEKKSLTGHYLKKYLSNIGEKTFQDN